MKYDNFQEIPQFPKAYYRVDVGWDYLNTTLEHWHNPDMGNPLILNPEWQRGHVWSKQQQIKYVEFVLKGGTTGKEIYFNCSSWQCEYNTPTYCVDGLQRLTAAKRFMNNEIPAFGTHLKDFKGKMRGNAHVRFSFNMLMMKNKRELLNLYIMFNSGGVVHKPKEIERIKKILEETPENETI
jgi:hypothetical protein